MDAYPRRLLITSLFFLATLAGVLVVGVLTPVQTSVARPGYYTYTLDHGGLVRFNNGKAEIETPYPFSISADPLQVPRFVGAWEGVDFPLNLAAYTSVAPELIINRAYRGSGNERVTFTVVGSDTSRKLHRPEICYRAANWTVTDLPDRTIALEAGEITVRQFVTRDTLDQEHLVLYWYLWKDGRRRIEDGAFVMHTSVLQNNRTPDAAGRVADSFVREIFSRRIESAPAFVRAAETGR